MFLCAIYVNAVIYKEREEGGRTTDRQTEGQTDR